MKNNKILDKATKHFNEAISGELKEYYVKEWEETNYYKKGTNFAMETKVIEFQNQGKTAEQIDKLHKQNEALRKELEAAKQANEELKQQLELRHHTDWHEDDGFCLFTFTKDGEWWGSEYTSPLSCDFPDIINEGLNAYFQKVIIPTPPESEDRN